MSGTRVLVLQPKPCSMNESSTFFVQNSYYAIQNHSITVLLLLIKLLQFYSIVN